jgi:hypothetical protein
MHPDEVLEALETASLDAGQFQHADHLKAAWALLRREPLPAALATFSSALSRLAAHHGKPQHYHETVTWFFLFLLNERLAAMPAEHDWGELEARNRDLFVPHRELLAAYYSPARLESPLARRAFVLPDLRR